MTCVCVHTNFQTLHSNPQSCEVATLQVVLHNNLASRNAGSIASCKFPGDITSARPTAAAARRPKTAISDRPSGRQICHRPPRRFRVSCCSMYRPPASRCRLSTPATCSALRLSTCYCCCSCCICECETVQLATGSS